MIEESHSRETRRGGSDRNFGFVFASVCLFLCLWPLRHGKPIRPAYLALSAVLWGIALVRPALLRIPNRLWTALGMLLGKVVSPVATAVLFYAAFTPFGAIRRWMGRDSLGLAFEPGAPTYWIPRDRSDDLSAGMTRQF